jgi:hypothetical protein
MFVPHPVLFHLPGQQFLDDLQQRAERRPGDQAVTSAQETPVRALTSMNRSSSETGSDMPATILRYSCRIVLSGSAIGWKYRRRARPFSVRYRENVRPGIDRKYFRDRHNLQCLDQLFENAG